MSSGGGRRCPGCRSSLETGPVCRRCGSDFSLVREAERQALALYCRAISAWSRKERELAQSLLSSALFLDRELPGAREIDRLFSGRSGGKIPFETADLPEKEPSSGIATPRAVRLDLPGSGRPVYLRKKVPLPRKGLGTSSRKYPEIPILRLV
ncbi:MAG: hypothetical protein M1313_02135 [Nitrospirae bacterium]|nr:hypothetical protein [Nitrospirota bacterium]